MHQALVRQLRALRLSPASGPETTATWGRLLEGVSESYASADQTRSELERSITSRAGAMQDLNWRLGQRVAQHEALQRVAIAVASGGGAKRVFDLIAAEVSALLQVESGCLMRVAPGALVGEQLGWWDHEHGSEMDMDRKPLLLADDTASGRAFLSGRPAHIAAYDPTTGPGAHGLVARGFRAGAAAPILIGTNRWGVVAVAAKARELRAGSETVLAEFASLAAIAIGNTEARAELARRAVSDPLTGLLNQGEWHRRLARSVVKYRAEGHPLSIAILDIDHFKRVNDRFGHLVGDDVIVEVVRRLRSAVRSDGQLGRAGGEEFALMLPGCDLATAVQVGERARQAIRRLPFAHVGEITVSIGVAELQPGNDSRGVYRAADEALYQAKAAGRDRVCAATAPRGRELAVPRGGPVRR